MRLDSQFCFGSVERQFRQVELVFEKRKRETLFIKQNELM